MDNSTNTECGTIRVGGKTNVGTLCGYIHARLNEDGGLTLTAIGPNAINTAVKAIALARSQMQSDSRDISMKPSFEEIIMDDIKVDGEAISEEGKEVINQAIAIGAEQPRTHIGMKLFVEYCSKISVNQSTQNRGNPVTKQPEPKSVHKGVNSSVKVENQGARSKGGRASKGTSDRIKNVNEYLNLKSKEVECNSNGIPRVK